MIEAESSIRISFLADYPEFVRVLAPEILDHLRHAFDMEETVEVREAKLRTQLNKVVLPVALVAHRGSEVLGTAALRASELEGCEDLSPWLGGVFVREPYRCRGIASSLIRAVERLAWFFGHRTLYLFTPDQQRLYSRLGWMQFKQTVYRGISVDIMIRTGGQSEVQ